MARDSSPRRGVRLRDVPVNEPVNGRSRARARTRARARVRAPPAPLQRRPGLVVVRVRRARRVTEIGPGRLIRRPDAPRAVRLLGGAGLSLADQLALAHLPLAQAAVE